MRRRFPENMRAVSGHIETLEVRRLMSSPQGAGDATPPSVISSVFEWDARQAVTFNFSEPIEPATVSTSDLSSLNLDNAQAPVPLSVVMSAGNTGITWIYNSTGSYIGDGHYKFTIAANAVTDLAGNGLAPSYTLVFGSINYFAGDANRDHRVNTIDFNILAGNFGLSGRTFAQGNFNYAGTVDSTDYGILLSQYGKILPLPAPLPSASIVQSPIFSIGSVRDAGEPIDLLR